MALALFGPIGAPELMIILVLGLLMFGGKLPDIARSVGRSVNQFKKGLKDIDEDLKEDERRTSSPPKTLPSPPSAPAEGAGATTAASSDTSSTAPH